MLEIPRMKVRHKHTLLSRDSVVLVSQWRFDQTELTQTDGCRSEKVETTERWRLAQLLHRVTAVGQGKFEDRPDVSILGFTSVHGREESSDVQRPGKIEDSSRKPIVLRNRN
jgi:hypothetical protein